MADLLDVISLDEGRSAVSLSGSSGTVHDSTFESWITTVSQRMDFLCGPIVQRTITDERHSGGTDAVWLKNTPVVSITSVTEYAGGTATVLTAETETVAGTYRLENGVLYRRSGWYGSTFGSQSVLVTYVAGRYATTEDVGARFKTVAQMALRRIWDREAAAWARTPDAFSDIGDSVPRFFQVIDPVVRELLSDEMTLEGHGVVIA